VKSWIWKTEPANSINLPRVIEMHKIESMDPGDEEGDEPTIYGDPGD